MQSTTMTHISNFDVLTVPVLTVFVLSAVQQFRMICRVRRYCMGCPLAGPRGFKTIN